MTSALLSIIWAALQLALFVLQKIKENELISQGEANALKSLMDQANAIIQQVKLDRASPLPGVVIRDEYSRPDEPVPGGDPQAGNLPVVLPDPLQPVPGQHTDSTADNSAKPSVDKSGV